MLLTAPLLLVSSPWPAARRAPQRRGAGAGGVWGEGRGMAGGGEGRERRGGGRGAGCGHVRAVCLRAGRRQRGQPPTAPTPQNRSGPL